MVEIWIIWGNVMFLHLDVTPPSGQHHRPPPPSQEVGGTHPTGMHSCYCIFLVELTLHVFSN